MREEEIDEGKEETEEEREREEKMEVPAVCWEYDFDRFCDALLSIRQEIEDVVQGKIAVEESPLKVSILFLFLLLSSSFRF